MGNQQNTAPGPARRILGSTAPLILLAALLLATPAAHAAGFVCGRAGAGDAANAIALADFADACGDSAKADSQDSSAFGHLAHAEGGNSSAYGFSAYAEGGNSSAFGDRARAQGALSSAYGNDAHAEGNNSSAYGDRAHAQGAFSIAIGSQHCRP